MTCELEITTLEFDIFWRFEIQIPVQKKLLLIDRQSVIFLCDKNPIVNENKSHRKVTDGRSFKPNVGCRGPHRSQTNSFDSVQIL
jgi:hypothetical protein